MTDIGFDPISILERLHAQGVKYVVIGGLAAVLQGSPLVTRDVDICYARTSTNMRALAAALRELRARLRGAPEEVPFKLDEATIAAGDAFTFETTAGNLDCLGTPNGTKGYDELAANAVRIDLDGLEILVASVDDVIRMKRAAGRPRDLLLIPELEALRDELEDDGG